MTFKTCAVPRTDIPETRRPPGSINDALHQLPIMRRHVHNLEGKILFLPRTGFVVIPTDIRDDGWSCQIIEGNETYLPHGYRIHVSNWELQRAPEMRAVLGQGPALYHKQFGVREIGAPDDVEPTWFETQKNAREHHTPGTTKLYFRHVYYFSGGVVD